MTNQNPLLMRRLSVLLAVFTLVVCSCSEESIQLRDGKDVRKAHVKPGDPVSELIHTYYGPAQQLGDGIVKSYYSELHDGTPVEIGVKISLKGLNDLPTEEHEYGYYLALHPKAAETGFTFIGFGWNPHGHEPPGVYEIPHFDVHFYFVPMEDVLSIAPGDLAGFNNHPAPMYQPPMYFAPPGGVPQMGAHWVDLLAPEFNGGTFTKTFIYGSFDGKFTFYEPMVTLDYLLSQPDETIPIRLPGAFQEDGYHPTDYRITYDSKTRSYTVAIINLTQHEGE